MGAVVSVREHDWRFFLRGKKIYLQQIVGAHLLSFKSPVVTTITKTITFKFKLKLVFVLSTLCFSMSLLNIKAHAMHGASNATESMVSSNVPYLVSIRQKGKSGDLFHLCGGAILKDKYILTAAHCVAGLDATNSDLQIYFGHTKLSQQQKIADVEYIYIHPEYEVHRPQFRVRDDLISYDFGGYNDIAILRISPIPLSEGIIESVVLPDESFVLDETKLAELHGWGLVNKSDIPDDLQYSHDFQVITSKDPEDFLSEESKNHLRGIHYSGVFVGLSDFYFNSKTILMHSKNPDVIPCVGDSGSPVVQNYNGTPVLIGLISSTMDYRCGGQRNNTTVLTDVRSLRTWINNVLLSDYMSI